MEGRVSAILCILLIASMVCLPASSVAETEEIVVESNLTWSDDMSITGNVRVVNGGSLTLSNAHFSISGGVEIFIDNSSSISMHESSISPSPNNETEGEGEDFSIVVDGEMHANNSTIIGGVISASGSISITNTSLEGVGPVILESDQSSINLDGLSKFVNSTDDHDIRAKAYSTINWGDDVSGSGGSTKKWERRLSGQSLIFDAVFVDYEITGMYEEAVFTNFSNEEGISFINGGRERVIEIAWSDEMSTNSEPIWREQAIVSVTEYRTAWNPSSSGIGNYGGGQFQLTWDSTIVVDSGTPEITWSSITPVDGEGTIIVESDIGDSVDIEAVISNSGDAAAKVAINCDLESTGIQAQISPQFPNTLVGPGEQATISFSWRSSFSGEESISCSILTPTQLVNDTAFGGGIMTSSGVLWVDNSDADSGSLSILPALIALVIGAGIGGYFLLSIYREQDFEEDYERGYDD